MRVTRTSRSRSRATAFPTENESPNTTIFNRGITGWGARLAVADDCLDVNSGYWYDDVHAQLPAHEPSAPWTSSSPDWGQRKLVEYYDMWSQDSSIGCPDTSGASDHGTKVTPTATGNCSLDAEGVATQTDAANSDGDQDGNAPGAKLVFQDHANFGYHGEGGDLGELFDLAYDNTCLDGDCHIDAHNNSWGSGGNIYENDSFAGDRALWRRQHGVIIASLGNSGNGSYGNSLAPATAKNVIGVGGGADCSADVMWGGSSRGPAGDGRLKPDVVATSEGVTTTDNDGDNSNTNGGCAQSSTSNGTSYAGPVVTGLAGLVLQYLNDGFYPSGVATPFDTREPSGPLMKAMLINTAQRMTDTISAERNGVGWPNMDQGWGFVVLENSLFFTGDARKLWVYDDRVGVDASGFASTRTFSRKVTSSSEPLKVTLVWYDSEHAGGCGPGVPCLNNDLDLSIFEPIGGDSWTTTLMAGTAGHEVPRTVVPAGPAGAGQTLTDNGPDDLNPVEQIIIYDPTPDRVYEITVTASNTPDGSIPFALVVTGAIEGSCSGPSGTAAIAAVDTDSCTNSGVQISWSQDVTGWNDGGSGTRYYRVWRDGLPVASGPCAGEIPYGTTSCTDVGGAARRRGRLPRRVRQRLRARRRPPQSRPRPDAVDFLVRRHAAAAPTPAPAPTSSSMRRWIFRAATATSGREDGVDSPRRDLGAA